MLMDDLRQDVRYALRGFGRSPLFALTAVLSLAIGIGADTTIFSVANALLLRPPAGVVEPERLVDVSGTDDDRFGVNEISFLNYVDLRERVTTISDIYGYEPVSEPMSLAGPDGAERVFGHRVTPNYFAALGVAAVVGRVFDATARVQADGDVVVLSHSFWARRFNKDQGMVGTTVSVNGRPVTILGVAAEEFSGTSIVATDLWTTLATVPVEGSFLTRRDLGWALLRGRLKPGVAVAQAAAELDAIGRALAREYPEQNAERGLQVARASFIPGNLSLPLAGVLTLLLIFVSLVLATACANLAGLLLARAAARRREIAVRVAIGAGRAQLIRQLLTEVTLLFIIGGAAGLLLAAALTGIISKFLPALPVPVDMSLELDGRVFAFTGGVSFIAAVLCGLVPALHASRPDVIAALKADTQGASRRSRARNAFVLCQVAFSVVLVAGAGLFVRALQKATAIDPGFEPHGVELAAVDLALAGYTPSNAPTFLRELHERVRTISAVENATIAGVLPTGGALRFGILTHPGAQPGRGGGVLPAEWNAVAPGYFATMRIPLVRGRDFNASDTAAAERVLIVSEEAARRFWPGQDPIGKFVMQHPAVFRRGEANEPTSLRVVGVAGNVKVLSRDAARAQVYLPLQQQFVSNVTIAARTTGGRRVARELRDAVMSLNANLPILSSGTLEDAAMFALLPQRVSAAVSGALGIVGLLLVGMGIYGVTAYTVTHRTREIGIRLALGAQRRQIVRWVLRDATLLMALGCTIGVTMAILAQAVLTRVFSDFPAFDPAPFAAAMPLFAGIGLAASYVPVRRAMRVDPVGALRHD